MTAQMHTPKPRQELMADIIRPSREKSEDRPASLLWLDKNENTDTTYIDSIQKLIASIPAAALFGYPDCNSLYKKLAHYLQTDINQLIIAAGSDGIIRAVYETFVAPGDTVIYTEPTFAMYALYAQMAGAHSLHLHYEPSENGPVLSAETVIYAIETAKPRLVCLPNPNSPSGTVFKTEDLHGIIQAAGRAGAVMLIDEAYHPFYPETALPWIKDYPHLVVARTFSKAWGMAGIRLGYGIACKSLINELHKIRPMYEAGALSMTLAERLLDHHDAMLASVQRLNEGKHYFIREMQKMNLRTFPSHGNFLHVALGSHAEAVHQALADKVLYRRDFAHPSLAGYSRFTATTKELFTPIVQQIRTVVNEKVEVA